MSGDIFGSQNKSSLVPRLYPKSAFNFQQKTHPQAPYYQAGSPPYKASADVQKVDEYQASGYLGVMIDVDFSGWMIHSSSDVVSIIMEKPTEGKSSSVVTSNDMAKLTNGKGSSVVTSNDMAKFTKGKGSSVVTTYDIEKVVCQAVKDYLAATKARNYVICLKETEVSIESFIETARTREQPFTLLDMAITLDVSSNHMYIGSTTVETRSEGNTGLITKPIRLNYMFDKSLHIYADYYKEHLNRFVISNLRALSMKEPNL